MKDKKAIFFTNLAAFVAKTLLSLKNG